MNRTMCGSTVHVKAALKAECLVAIATETNWADQVDTGKGKGGKANDGGGVGKGKGKLPPGLGCSDRCQPPVEAAIDGSCDCFSDP